MNLEKFVGAYCVVRCHDAGVHAGVVDEIEGRAVILSEARRLWKWVVRSGDFLSSVANNGIAKGSKVGEPLAGGLLLTEDCEIAICTPEAEKSIREFPSHEGNE